MTAAPPSAFPAGSGSRDEPSTGRAGPSFKLLSGGARGPLDPYRAAQESTGLWQKYLHTCFASHRDVARAFGVSERCAAKWWSGETGCKLDKARVAVDLHPEAAVAILFPTRKAG